MDWQRLARFGRLTPPVVRRAVADRMLFADVESVRTFRRAMRDQTGQVVQLRLRALPHPFLVRAGTDDPIVLREVVSYNDVMPPEGFVPTRILNLGANIGAAIALLAAQFPAARIVGVEPDLESASLCSRNAEPYGGKVIRAAAWIEDGAVAISGSSAAVLKISPEGVRVPAISLSTLVDKVRPDFMTMDIEGTERELLNTNTEWAAKVPCVSIEVHEPYTTKMCRDDLRRLGYSVSIKAAPRGPRVVGRR